MIDTEKKLAQMNVGRMARMISDELAPYLKDLENRTIDEMKMRFRNGELTERVAIAGAASLCVLDDLRNALNARIAMGDRVKKEELDG